MTLDRPALSPVPRAGVIQQGDIDPEHPDIVKQPGQYDLAGLGPPV